MKLGETCITSICLNDPMTYVSLFIISQLLALFMISSYDRKVLLRTKKVLSTENSICNI